MIKFVTFAGKMNLILHAKFERSNVKGIDTDELHLLLAALLYTLQKV